MRRESDHDQRIATKLDPLLGGLLAGVGLALVPLYPLPAAAFFVPGNPACGFDSSFGYGFDGPDWTEDREDWFRDGETVWNVVKDPYGDLAAFAYEGGPIEIQLDDIVDGQGGLTYCTLGPPGDLNRIVFDTEEEGIDPMSGDTFRGISAHEVGHALGLAHVGRLDSWDGADGGSGPTMTSGCMMTSTFTAASLYTLESDDWAALVSMRFPEIQANASFESGLNKWESHGGSWSTPTTGGHVGPRYAEISTGSYLVQRVRITDPQDDLTPRISIKKGSLGATGTIRFVVKARELDYDTHGPCLGDLPNGWDFLAPTPGAWTTVSDSTFSPSFAWTAITTIAEWTAVSGWDGADIEIRVYNQLSSGTADIDYARTDKSCGTCT